MFSSNPASSPTPAEGHADTGWRVRQVPPPPRVWNRGLDTVLGAAHVSSRVDHAEKDSSRRPGSSLESLDIEAGWCCLDVAIRVEGEQGGLAPLMASLEGHARTSRVHAA